MVKIVHLMIPLPLEEVEAVTKMGAEVLMVGLVEEELREMWRGTEILALEHRDRETVVELGSSLEPVPRTTLVEEAVQEKRVMMGMTKSLEREEME